MHFLRSVAIVATVLTFGSVVMATKTPKEVPKEGAKPAADESLIAAHAKTMHELISSDKRYGKVYDLLKKKTYWESLVTLKDGAAAAELNKVFTAINTGLLTLSAEGDKTATAGKETTELAAAVKTVSKTGADIVGGGDPKDFNAVKYVEDITTIFTKLNALKTNATTNKTVKDVKSVDDLAKILLDALNLVDTKDLVGDHKTNVDAIKAAIAAGYTTSDDDGMPLWQIILIIVAVIALIVIIGLVIYFVVLKRK